MLSVPSSRWRVTTVSGSRSRASSADHTGPFASITGRSSARLNPSSSISATPPSDRRLRYEASAPTRWRMVSRMDP